MNDDRLIEAGTDVTLVSATDATLAAEDYGGAELARLLGLSPPADWPPEFNDASTREWMRALLAQHPDEPGYGSWYVVADGRPVGIAGYKGPPDAGGEVEIGYSIVLADRLRGLASAAVGLLVDRAFRDPRVSAVIAETIPQLVASQRVLERNGFALVSRTPDEELGEILRYRRGRG